MSVCDVDGSWSHTTYIEIVGK